MDSCDKSIVDAQEWRYGSLTLIHQYVFLYENTEMAGCWHAILRQWRGHLITPFPVHIECTLWCDAIHWQVKATKGVTFHDGARRGIYDSDDKDPSFFKDKAGLPTVVFYCEVVYAACRYCGSMISKSTALAFARRFVYVVGDSTFWKSWPRNAHLIPAWISDYYHYKVGDENI